MLIIVLTDQLVIWSRKCVSARIGGAQTDWPSGYDCWRGRVLAVPHFFCGLAQVCVSTLSSAGSLHPAAPGPPGVSGVQSRMEIKPKEPGPQFTVSRRRVWILTSMWDFRFFLLSYIWKTIHRYWLYIFCFCFVIMGHWVEIHAQSFSVRLKQNGGGGVKGSASHTRQWTRKAKKYLYLHML